LIKNWWLICVFLCTFFTGNLGGGAHGDCGEALDSLAVREDVVGGKTVKYTSLTSATNRHDRKRENLFRNSENDLFIGVVGGHMYFIFRKHRFDGGSIGHLEKNSISDNDKFSSGLIIRVRNLPKDVSDSLEKNLSQGIATWPITCSSGVCGFLRRSGGLQVPGLFNLTPKGFATNIIKEGLKAPDGTPLQQDIYLLGQGDDSLSKVISQIPWDGEGLVD